LSSSYLYAENVPPTTVTAVDTFNPPTPPNFAHLLLSQDNVPEVDKDPTANEEPAKKSSRPHKRAGLILDSRIELTDEELKASFCFWNPYGYLTFITKSARARYLQDQMALRQENEIKRLEKEGNNLMDFMVFGIPMGSMCHYIAHQPRG
jgi:hypothetical protein